MPAVQETLETLSDKELSQLLDRISDDLELQRAELGLPVDETPDQIAAKRSQGAKMAGNMGAMGGMGGMGAMGGGESEDKVGVEAEVAAMPPEKQPAGEIVSAEETAAGENPKDDMPAATPEVDAISALIESKIGRTPDAAKKLAQMFVEAVGDPKAAQKSVEDALADSTGAHEAAPAFDGLFREKTGKGALGAIL